MGVISRICVAAASVSCLALRASAQIIYSENFDSGSTGESLTDPQFGYVLHNTNGGGGDLKLGPAQHGWSGKSIIGQSADAGQINLLYKLLPLPAHGIIQFSADLFSSTVVGTSDEEDVGIQLIHNSPDGPGFEAFELRAQPGHWGSDDSSASRNFWDSPSGLHDEPVRGSLFWNQDTTEHWTEITDGTTTFVSPHFFAPGLGPMNGLDLYIDRRTNNPVAGDIDNVVVQAVPEPATLAMVMFGLAVLKTRRR